MNLMTSGATNKDAPSATTGLAHTIVFYECEQIAEMIKLQKTRDCQSI